MESNKKILAIIPARGGSKRIPKKNVRFLFGKPLIAYTIEYALKSQLIDKVVVSTDDEEIMKISKDYGAGIIKRPKEIAGDEASVQLAIEHTLDYLAENENYKPDAVVLLQPTSPLRNNLHIDEAISKFLEDKYDSLLSVCPFPTFLWKAKDNNAVPVNYDFRNRPRTQDKEPDFKETGAIYVTSCDIITKEHNVLGGKIGLYVISEQDSIDIDSEDDFSLCENILQNKKNIKLS